MAALQRRFDFVANEDNTDSSTYVRLGECTVDLSLFVTPLQGLTTRTVKFVANLDTDGGVGVIADVKLYNQTNVEDVTGCNLTHNDSTPTEKSSAALTVGVAAGNIRSGSALYVAYLKMTGGTVGVNRVYCTNMRLTLDYAP
jgi:hypothetical protein